MFRTISCGMLLTGALLAQQGFDFVVRNDFFAGFAGDRAALDRGMKRCEEVLAANPKSAEAMVWHGAGVFYSSGEAAQKQDYVAAGELFRKGVNEMAAAVALEPDNLGVIIPRGAVLITASRTIPGDRSAELLTTGLADFEKAYRLQQSYFDRLSGHQRGELLFGLAEGSMRAGRAEQAREWFTKLAAVGESSGHLAQAREYLANGALAQKNVTCVGCHAGK